MGRALTRRIITPSALLGGLIAGGLVMGMPGSIAAFGQGSGGLIPFDARTGFQQIFDGTTLGQWDGDPAFWRVEARAIVGESTAQNPVKVNTFLIWRGGEPADFELKLEFRIHATNSGVQYRSAEVAGAGKWVLKGYQADIDFDNQYTGMLYEERGRGILAPRGTFGYIGPGGAPRGQIGALESGKALTAVIRQGGWNQLHVLARGAVLMHVLNGHVTALWVDDDPAGRAAKGLLGLQLHTGPPMKVEFRDIFLKTL